MKTRLEQYIETIVQHTDCSKSEKEDLREELLIHLQLLREELIENGLSNVEAEKEAINLFGREAEIGSGLQQSYFPFRKEMILTLAISSLFFSITIYLFQLFHIGDAYIIWIISAMAINSMLLFFSLNQFANFNRKRWVNGLLITHIFVSVYGYGMTTNLDHPASTALTIWVWLNIILSLLLVYRTTIYDYHFGGTLSKEKKLLHIINITAGIFIIAASLFLVYGGLIMIGEFHFIMIIFASPILIWIGLYIAQIKLLPFYKKIAYTLTSIPVIAALLIISYPAIMMLLS
jgi:hypothetical protein